mmetsp:Transcript_14503/g.29811  ORF Transcript_14503/g.29811 Transcript_14503/m.29811 type:complete len:119 (+) Transcript_14503:955-1311(+)
MTRTLSMAAVAKDQVRRDPPCAVTGDELSQILFISLGPPPLIASSILREASATLDAAAGGGGREAANFVPNFLGASETKAAVPDAPAWKAASTRSLLENFIVATLMISDPQFLLDLVL